MFNFCKKMKKIEEIKNEISRDLGNENFKELFKNAVRNMPIEKAFLKINDIINEASLKMISKKSPQKMKPEVRRFVNAQKRKKIITVKQMYFENLIKEKRKNKSIPRKEVY